MEFHIPYLKRIKEIGWETSVAARNDYENHSECAIPYCDMYYDVPFERNPFNPKNLRAFKMLKKVINEGHYDIIHCHTPVGAMMTRLASGKARKKGSKVIYTAHGFHFYKGAPLLNWILYYPVERLLARKTDVLITITHEDYSRARSFKMKRLEYVPGVGIDFAKYRKLIDNSKEALKEELGIPSGAKVLLSVGELNKNKNHRMVIKALPSLANTYYVICGQGPLYQKHRELAKDIGVDDRVKLVGYRKDVCKFYNMADVFVFPSFREGLPVSLMEAMSTGLVCVSSYNRGSDDLLRDSRLRFAPSDLQEIIDKIKIALTTDCSDEVRQNREVLNQYALDVVLNQVEQIYLEETKHEVE